ncbi:JAB domain-containing protein [Wolbachia endosymbiont (group A) of Nomada hirtipes]|uniref:JAB domain-containing protein n=1 Tax=Wolbachia endosymbiont (group A) of Nomada hirtipes TaxID=3066208 RepID=UPI0030D07ACE
MLRSVRIIVKRAIEPSKEDEDNTLTLAATCENVGMKLIDHIIVTQKSHFSFYDSGLL